MQSLNIPVKFVNLAVDCARLAAKLCSNLRQQRELIGGRWGMARRVDKIFDLKTFQLERVDDVESH